MTSWPGAPDAPRRYGVPSCTCCTSHAMRIPTTGLHSSRPATGDRWTRTRSAHNDEPHDCIAPSPRVTRHQRFDSEAKSDTMIRQLSLLTLVTFLVGGV